MEFLRALASDEARCARFAVNDAVEKTDIAADSVWR